MADRSARLAFILSLTDKVSAPLGKVKTSFSDLATKGEANIKQMALGLGGMVGAAKGISESLQPALEMNRALGEVRSLGVAEDALTSLNQKALEFSVNYGTNARDFAASAYSISGAIKGLVGDQLATFTNTSNLLAKATKSDAETMGAYVGTMYNLFKTSADAMGKSQWVEKLGGQTALAAQLFRTDGAQLKDAFKEVGQIANTAGVDIAEQFAVIGTLSSTMEGGDAGGLYKSFFENIGAASEKLKMKFTEQNGQLMPMADILAKLEGKFGDLNSAAAGTKLTEAFGGEGARVITALAKDTDRFRNGLDQLGKVRGLENAEKMAKAMVDPWQQFGAAVEALRTSFGQALIPMLTPLMDKLVAIASTLTRWTQIFPNITRVVGITVLVILGLVAAMSAVTLVVGISKMAWMGALVVWRLLNWQGYKSIAMFVLHTVVFAGFVVAMVAMYAWMGLVRVGMMAWQGVIWLVNAAMAANPVMLIVLGIIALGVVIAAAIVYWDQWTGALMNTAAFQWIAGQLQALSDWFGSIGGWTGMAKAAWDGIVGIFRTAISGLIAMINKIPGVEIDASFGDMPKAPEIPGIEAQVPTTPAVDRALQAAMPGNAAAAPQGAALLQRPVALATPLAATAQPAPVLPVPTLVMAAAQNTQVDDARQRMAANNANLSPSRPNAVPQGGLLRSIQNTTNNQTQNQGTHVETLNINTAKPMTPLEIENMMSMAVGG